LTRVRWAELDPKTVEDVISMLLNHLHPDRAQRIDGSGGDGGRDVQLTLDDGLHLYEIKSFTGRLDASRKAQIERSLSRASLLDPASWTLLMPLDPTPREADWLNALGSRVPFPAEWHGLSWLDAELAPRPFIARYLVEGTGEEVMEILRMAREEEAGLLGGAPEAVERVERVVNLLNEQNPR
jgi:hypothetical protein